MKKILFLPFFLIACSAVAQELPLYENAVPNSRPTSKKETAVDKENVLRITNVSVPTLTIFAAAKPNGQAVIICPGGAYTLLAWDKEGTRVAAELNKIGVSAFVLKYRLPDDGANIDRSLAPLQDAQQAIRLLRKNAPRYKIDPTKIGIMGFSAGGHLASTAATHFWFKADPSNHDTTSVRPDFAILIYPVISFDSAITNKGSRDNLVGKHPTDSVARFFSNELQINYATPPIFLIHAGNDEAVPVENSLRFYEACIRNKVPVEMHLYPNGGHGFGMYNTTTPDKWIERLANWLQTINRK